jgi:hypothetical protein
MDKTELTLSELRAFAQELGIPGIYSKENQNKAHLHSYIYWWLELDDQEHSAPPEPESAEVSQAGEALHPDMNMRDGSTASKFTPQDFLDNTGVFCLPTRNEWTYSVVWDDWEIGEGRDKDDFHYLDVIHSPTGMCWMVALKDFGNDFWDAFERLTRTIKSLEFNFEEDAIYYRCFKFQILPKTTRLRLATLSALAVSVMTELWKEFVEERDNPFFPSSGMDCQKSRLLTLRETLSQPVLGVN